MTDLCKTKTFITTTNPSMYFTDEKHVTRSDSIPKNNFCLGDEIAFESAVKDFNSVVEDVEKICTKNSSIETPKRIRNRVTTDQRNSDRAFQEDSHQTPREQNEGDETRQISYSASSCSERSDSNEEKEESIVNGNLVSASDQIYDLHYDQGKYLHMYTCFNLYI